MDKEFDILLREELRQRTEKQTQKFGCRPGWRYTCLEDLVLQNGQAYLPQPLPRRFRHGRSGQCYFNSFNTALRHGLIYVEGYAMGKLGAGDVHIHAWCVEAGSTTVIDRTWSEGLAYLGVPFDFGFVKRTMGQRKAYGVLDNWEHEAWPILKLLPSEWLYRANDSR